MADCTAEEIAAKLLAEPRKEFLVYFHEKPDGDAVGSAYALVIALQAVGARAAAFCADAAELAERYFRSKSKARMKAEKYMIESFHYLCDGRIVSACRPMNNCKAAVCGTMKPRD